MTWKILSTEAGNAPQWQAMTDDRPAAYTETLAISACGHQNEMRAG
jgi:hypothetical protein